MRISLPIKLMASYLLVAGLIVAPTLVSLRGSLVSALEEFEARSLKAPAEVARARLDGVADRDLEKVARDFARLLGLRITVIDKEGVVLADSDVTAARLPTLENHRQRPEMAAALAGEYGYSIRKSATLGVELLYGAVPAQAAGSTRAVVRVARPAAPVRDVVRGAILPQRIAAGVGVSAAIGLSLIAALFLSSPLRRMRDAARAFAESRWVTVRRLRTGDELEDLSVALDELGKRLREQMVEVGAQEALLTQAVRAFPLPAVVLQPDLTPLLVNGAFRQFASITAANEGERLTELTKSRRLLAARELAEKSGLPTEMALIPPGSATGDSDHAARRSLLVPLARPSAPPLWLVVTDLEGPESEARGPEPVQRFLRSAEIILERLWNEQPELRPVLAQLHLRLDDAARAAGRPEPVGVEPVDAVALVERVADEVRALYPRMAEQLVLDLPQASAKIAESAGLAARAVRAFLGGGLRVLGRGRLLEVSLRVEPTEVRLTLEGAAPVDLEPVREIARALGTDVGRIPTREREAAWLVLPRA